MNFFEDAQLKKRCQKRPNDADKTLFGHVLVLGGDLGMWGAVHLAAKAALGMGAGLISALTHEVHAPFVSVNRPEIMSAAFQDEAKRVAVAKRATHLVVGPGLTGSYFSEEVFAFALNLNLPILIDAGALRMLAKLHLNLNNAILTPHVGEAAALLDCTKEEIQQDRPGACMRIAEKYGATVVLKGAGTVVCERNAQPQICPWGNPYMASGGMGDALSGLIMGWMASNRAKLMEAAVMGVALHAKAGDRLMQAGPHGFFADEVIQKAVECLNAYHSPH